ncbi:MAG: fused MFS/spermidine synthase, partial [Oscillospiraceae bacterium]|nr:fused MFS/spermidine synthase [Oscillospiraceae bacterium]
SVYIRDGSLTGLYYDYALAAPMMTPEPAQDLLILGMGTGTYATQCGRYFPQLHAEGVEIDGKITDLARDYFSLDPAVSVTTYDGRAYLAGTDRLYDVIMVDAYQDITIPFQMSTREFFTMVRSHLKEHGVMIVNMNMTSDAEDGINACLQDTICAVFDHVYTADVRGSSNRELFASQDAEMTERLAANIAECENGALRDMLTQVQERLVRCEAGSRILTDDKAPVELLGMKTIDSMISEQLSYYRERFEKDGIAGIIGG